MAQSAAPRSENNPEIARRFVPTPERLSQYLERNVDDVMAEFASVEGREKIRQNLLAHERDLRKIDPAFNPDELGRQIELVGETLQQKERFLRAAQAPENKGLFRRAWDRVKGFVKKHPVVTALLALALAAGGVAIGFYAAGQWELFLASTGLSKILGGVEAARELIPPTPSTTPLPGGGMFEVPPPTSPPGTGIVT